MNTPVILWTVIIGIFVATIIIRFAVEIIRYLHDGHSHAIFRFGSEREEFFVPGDPKDDDEDLLYDED